MYRIRVQKYGEILNGIDFLSTLPNRAKFYLPSDISLFEIDLFLQNIIPQKKNKIIALLN